MKKSKVEVYSLKNGKSELKLIYPELRKVVLTIRAVNHDLRKEIIRLLTIQDKMTVTQLYVKLRLEQSVASQHLAILRKSGIVVTEREGKFIYYILNKERLKEVNDLIVALAI